MSASRHTFLFAVCFIFLGTARLPAQIDARTARWAESVVVGTEFGGNGKFTARWVKSPTLSVFNGTPTQENYVADVVSALNETLMHTPIKRIRPVDANTASADLHVYFLKLDDMPAQCKKLGFKHTPGNWGLFNMFWNGDREIQRAYVLIATDKLQGKRMQHFLLEEITQSLGLACDSPEFEDSIFYEKNNDGGNAQKLSDRDQKLIRFFYNHVPAGSDAAAVRAALKKHWKDS